MTSEVPSADEKKAALDEVLASTVLLRASQLQRFLRFVGEMEISGRGAEINEYLIGVEALGRPADYSPVEDAAVRRRAADLRQKLEEAYATELRRARVRIDLPKGGYVPRFLRVESVATEGAAAAAPASGPVAPTPSAPWRTFNAFWFAAGLAIGALLAGIGIALYLRFPAVPKPSAERGTTFEAEASTSVLGGVTYRDACAACSNGGRVRRIGNSPANSVTIKGVTSTTPGNTAIAILYLLEGNRSFYVSVNDAPGVEVAVKGDSWLVPARVEVSLPLAAGTNTLRFYNDAAYAPDLDRIVVR
jgi:hypothetical protein